MNIYEEAEYEAEDYFCIYCGRQLSTTEYLENSGYCNDCADEFSSIFQNLESN